MSTSSMCFGCGPTTNRWNRPDMPQGASAQLMLWRVSGIAHARTEPLRRRAGPLRRASPSMGEDGGSPREDALLCR